MRNVWSAASPRAKCDDWSDARDGHEPPAGFVLMSGLLDHRIGLVNPHRQLIKIQLQLGQQQAHGADRKSTRLNSSHQIISYPAFSLKKKTNSHTTHTLHPLPHTL